MLNLVSLIHLSMSQGWSKSFYKSDCVIAWYLFLHDRLDLEGGGLNLKFSQEI